jgi:hypothetical protein
MWAMLYTPKSAQHKYSKKDATCGSEAHKKQCSYSTEKKIKGYP